MLAALQLVLVVFVRPKPQAARARPAIKPNAYGRKAAKPASNFALMAAEPMQNLYNDPPADTGEQLQGAFVTVNSNAEVVFTRLASSTPCNLCARVT